MGTSAALIKQIGDKRYKCICVNYDGYPSHMLPILENYKDEETIQDLFELGDASFLDENLEKSIFYCRDRGEDWQGVALFAGSFEEVLEYLGSAVIYKYIFNDEIGSWGLW